MHSSSLMRTTSLLRAAATVGAGVTPVPITTTPSPSPNAVAAEKSLLRNLVPFRVGGGGPMATNLRIALTNRPELADRFLATLQQVVELPVLPRRLLAEGIQRVLEGDRPQRDLRHLFEDAETETRRVLLGITRDANGVEVQRQGAERLSFEAVQGNAHVRLLAYELYAACGYYARLLSVSSQPEVEAALAVRTLIATDVRTDAVLGQALQQFVDIPRDVHTGQRLVALPVTTAMFAKETLLMERDAFGVYRFDARGDNSNLFHNHKLDDVGKTPKSFSLMYDPVVVAAGNFEVESRKIHNGRWWSHQISCGPEHHIVDPPHLPSLEVLDGTDNVTEEPVRCRVCYSEPICQRHKLTTRESKGSLPHRQVIELAAEQSPRSFWAKYFMDR